MYIRPLPLTIYQSPVETTGDCCGSVAEHWWLKPEVSWVQFLAAAGLFTFLYIRLITSKFILIHLFPA